MLLPDKPGGNETFRHPFVFHLRPASLAALEPLDRCPRGHDSCSIINRPALGQSCQDRRAAERSVLPSLLDQHTSAFDLRALASITGGCEERGSGVNDRAGNAGKTNKQTKKEGRKEGRLSHKVPVDVSEEGVTHDVSEARLRVAAQALFGVLGEGRGERGKRRCGVMRWKTGTARHGKQERKSVKAENLQDVLKKTTTTTKQTLEIGLKR